MFEAYPAGLEEPIGGDSRIKIRADTINTFHVCSQYRTCVHCMGVCTQLDLCTDHLGADQLNTSIEFLDAVKIKHGIVSDYRLAKILNVSQPCVSRYRLKQSTLDDAICIKVAKLLEVEPATILAAVHAERAKTEAEKSAWKLIYEKLGGIAASLLIGTLLYSSAPTPSQAAGLQLPRDVYYVK